MMKKSFGFGLPPPFDTITVSRRQPEQIHLAGQGCQIGVGRNACPCHVRAQNAFECETSHNLISLLFPDFNSSTLPCLLIRFALFQFLSDPGVPGVRSMGPVVCNYVPPHKWGGDISSIYEVIRPH